MRVHKIEIDRDLFTKQIKEGMTIPQLRDYWGCSRTTITERKKEWGLVGLSPNSKPRDNGDGTKTCSACGETKSVNDFFSNGFAKSGKPKLKPKCKQCEQSFSRLKHIEKIIEVLAEQGREYKCELCGYDDNYAGLCFHHTTDEKNFQISSSRYISAERLAHEISICAVLCQNCHNEVHNPLMSKSVLFGGEKVST